MSKSPRALQELMTAVDAGHAVHVNVDSASSDSISSNKLLGPRHRRSTYYSRGGGGGGARKSAPAGMAVVEASADASSFEFSAVVNSYSSASPASMVFSDGQIRAHQFPAVRSSTGSSQATSPVRGSTVVVAKKQEAGVMTKSKRRVSFTMDEADKAGSGQGKKSGGLLGCCGPSSRKEAVEPVARSDNRKVVAV